MESTQKQSEPVSADNSGQSRVPTIKPRSGRPYCLSSNVGYIRMNKPRAICDYPRSHWHYPALDLPQVKVEGCNSYVPFTLRLCPQCNQLWLEYAYEPWSAYRHMVRWPGTEYHVSHLIKHHPKELLNWHRGIVSKEVTKRRLKPGSYGSVKVPDVPVDFESLPKPPNQPPQTRTTSGPA